jgi:hypothetical protein
MLITPQTLARPMTIIRHQVRSLGLKDRSLRKPELLEAIQRESPLFPTIAGWQRALVARDPLVLECMLNALTHFFLCLMPGPQAIDCRLALPTHYVHCWGARIPHLFVFLDQHEARDRPSSPKHVHQLEAMALEHEYYRPHLTRLEAWPEDVYRFARVVRAVSGLQAQHPDLQAADPADRMSYGCDSPLRQPRGHFRSRGKLGTPASQRRDDTPPT